MRNSYKAFGTKYRVDSKHYINIKHYQNALNSAWHIGGAVYIAVPSPITLHICKALKAKDIVFKECILH